MKISELLTLVISAVGACAWIPKLIETIIFHRTKLSAKILDIQSIKDFRAKVIDNQGKTKTIEGLLVILMLEFQYSNSSEMVFPFWKCSIRMALKDDNQLVDAVIVNNINFKKHSKTEPSQKLVPMRFDFPSHYNININTNIINTNNLINSNGALESDQNIRIIPCLLQRNSRLYPVRINDINTIQITLYNKRKKGKRVEVLGVDQALPQGGFIASFSKESSGNW